MKWNPESPHQSCLYIPVNLICGTRVDCEIMWLHIKVWLNSVCILMLEQCMHWALWWREGRRGREQENKQRKSPLQRIHIGKTELCWHLVNILSRRKIRLNKMLRHIKGPPCIFPCWYLPFIHRQYFQKCPPPPSPPTLIKLGKRCGWYGAKSSSHRVYPLYPSYPLHHFPGHCLCTGGAPNCDCGIRARR